MNKKSMIEIKHQISTSTNLELFEYVKQVYANQTLQEKGCRSTLDNNGVGFNKPHANRMSRIGNKVLNRKGISIEDMEYLRKTLPKYWRQIKLLKP